MDRNALLSIVTLAALLLGGCVPSLNGLSTGEDDIITDDSLVGTWTNDDQTYEITANNDRTYRVVHTGKEGKTGAFTATLVQVGDHRFLDLAPNRPDEETTGFHQSHLLSAHTFYLLEVNDDVINVRSLNIEWLKSHLNEEPDALAHAIVDDRLVLAATSKDLQAFLTEHIDTADAFTDPATFEAAD